MKKKSSETIKKKKRNLELKDVGDDPWPQSIMVKGQDASLRQLLAV